ncbi:hypothetical protein B0J14DRAFT_280132 [Halenospora varia]|nr:hypothetical protein B0J14DRAFT_280132 [Halenospora varia]
MLSTTALTLLSSLLVALAEATPIESYSPYPNKNPQILTLTGRSESWAGCPIHHLDKRRTRSNLPGRANLSITTSSPS